MSREQINKEIEGILGLVPSFFNFIPDDALPTEWDAFKRAQLQEGAIPQKYRELIGLAIAATSKCKYCLFYHTEVAKLHGATQSEIEDAVATAKSNNAWSTYITGMQTDFDQFKQEVLQVCEHVKMANVV